MDPFVGSGLNITVHATRKRSRSRRPRSDQQLLFEGYSVTPPSDNAPSSDNGSKRSSDSGSYDGGTQKKEYNLNNSILNVSSVNRIGVSSSSMRTLKDDTTSSEYDSMYRNGTMRDVLSQHSDHEKSKPDLKRCNIGKVKEISEIVPKLSDNLAKSGVGHQVCNSNVPGENRPRKVKLKMGGVTHTIHAKSNLDSISGNGLSDGTQNKQKHSIQQNITLSSEPVRKSKRVPKKRVLDGESDEEEDDEIRYLERLKRSKAGVSNLAGPEFYQRDAMPNKKNLKTSKIRKVCYEEDNEDTDYVEEEEEHGSDVGSETKRRNDKPLVFNDGRKEMTLTTRQRALQSSKDGSGGNGSSLIEFPDGLPPAPPRRQKEKLSEVEQQLKKAEAAQRRRLQVEKAARESEAEAIRKILGQDSSRKKREDKFRKKREEVAKEKAANSMIVASDMVRWVTGPTGTTVIFPEDPGLPNILKSNPCSYPPPREKCAGPSCTNAYKYRHSKSNLPVCSLQCYQAIQ